MSLEPALTAFGYPILYLGTILEGETFVIISAVLCQTGHLDVVWVVCKAFIGALTGDLICFLMGRFGGGNFIKRKPSWRQRADKASRLLARHQHFVVFSYRFFYGLRAVIPFLIGVTDYSFRRFIILSGAGALVWSITITLGGLICGEALLLIMSKVENLQLWFFTGLGLLAVICWAIYRCKHRNIHS